MILLLLVLDNFIVDSIIAAIGKEFPWFVILETYTTFLAWKSPMYLLALSLVRKSILKIFFENPKFFNVMSILLLWLLLRLFLRKWARFYQMVSNIAK